jgi:nitrogen fixation protein FixH
MTKGSEIDPMDTRASAKPLTGRRVLIYLVAFFAVVIGVNVVMAKLAIDTLPGTEVDNPYQAGLSYNGEISAAQAQATRGWNVAGHVERAADGHAAVRIEARDRDGAPVAGVVFSARLERPIDKRADHAIALSEREVGIYRGAAEGVAPGQWDLVLEADRGAQRLFLSRNRIVLK